MLEEELEQEEQLLEGDPVTFQCPYCGEIMDIFLDPELRKQKVIEDCRVCCNPVELRIDWNEDGLLVEASRS
ncbi:MAG: CPXCG motif-containing cysteine-rich protein [Elusimicrobia bacterium]|nr:CPXCG motif-containing cysteine-rich protein [Elusimicrobiota bacterium]